MPKKKKNHIIESDIDSIEDQSGDDFVIPHGQTERQRAKLRKSRNKLATDSPNAGSQRRDSESSTIIQHNETNTTSKKHKSSRKSDQKEKFCPVKGCHSQGHMTGRYEKHYTIAACPVYHNLDSDLTKQLYEERHKLKTARRRQLDNEDSSRNTHAVLSAKSEAREAKRRAINDIRSAHLVIDEATSNRWNEHESAHRHHREPLLDGVTPEYDLELFRHAQAKSSEEKDYETAMHYKLLADSGGSTPNRIKKLVIGKFEVETWYHSPYPEEISRLTKIYLCEFCLKYMKTPTTLRRHTTKCTWHYPPGNEIYRKGTLSIFEVDGRKNKTYCQNLCLLAKLFLDHKTLYYDVEPFLFYVMTEADEQGCHAVGYFSKEKHSIPNYNVSCIMTMPQYMRQGYGKMLIDFSYLLTRVEGKVGSPERPLSDLGLISYRSYWKDLLMEYLHKYTDSEIWIKDLSTKTGVITNDLISTLQSLSMLKYWKGLHVVLRNEEMVDDYITKKQKRSHEFKDKWIDPEYLNWKPKIYTQKTEI